MRNTHPLWKVFSAVAIAAIALAACAPGATPTPQVVRETQIVQQQVVVTPTPEPFRPKGTLTVGLTTDIAAIEVPYAPERQAVNASWTMYDSLVYQNPDGSLGPSLAESWEVSPDGTVITFKLRKGVKFHDGSDFTADDVVFSWKTYSADTVTYAGNWTLASNVEKVDDYTVKISTGKPNAMLLPTMAWNWAMIPENWGGKTQQEFAQSPIGTGPFVFKEWIKGDRLVVTANPNYWRQGYPKVEQVVFRFMPEAATRVAAVQTGEIDIAPRLTSEDAKSLLGVEGVTIVRYPVDRSYYLAFNNLSTGKGTPIENPKVRQALAYAIDMDGIIDAVFDGFATRSVGFVGPGNLGFDGAEPVPYDPEKAKALLAEAGYPNGFEIGMACPDAGYPKINEVCQAISEQLNAIGVKNELELQEANAYWDREAKKELPPLFVDSWSVTIGEAWPRLSGALNKGETYANWYDPKLDEMINQVVVTVDTEKRAALYREIQKYMRENPPFVYLYYPEAFEAVRTRVQGYKPRSAENYFLWEVSVSD
jgi:peptide/nickel transport system substrate-binding protein